MSLILIQTIVQAVSSTLTWLGFYIGIRALPDARARKSRGAGVFVDDVRLHIFPQRESAPGLHVIAQLFSGWGRLANPAALAAELANINLPPVYLLSAVGLIGLIEAVQFLRLAGPLRPRVAAMPLWSRWSFYYASVVAVLLFAQQNSRQFIYFRF
jgi:hypothetical protein